MAVFARQAVASVAASAFTSDLAFAECSISSSRRVGLAPSRLPAGADLILAARLAKLQCENKTAVCPADCTAMK